MTRTDGKAGARMNAEEHNMPARILIVDPHPAAREGLAFRISRQTDLEVCGEASDGAEAIELVGTARPDAAVLEMTLKSGSGIELIKHLKELHPDLRVLVWSSYLETHYAERSLRAGAEGFVHKQQPTDQVLDALRKILAGKIALSEPIADQLLRRSIGGALHAQGTISVEKLSDRELETFRLIGEGFSTNDISRKLETHMRTIETYLARIKRKFQFQNRQQLVQAATQWVLKSRQAANDTIR